MVDIPLKYMNFMLLSFWYEIHGYFRFDSACSYSYIASIRPGNSLSLYTDNYIWHIYMMHAFK